MKLDEVFLERSMAGRCETNRSVVKKERLVAVKLTEVFLEKKWLVAVKTPEVFLEKEWLVAVKLK